MRGALTEFRGEDTMNSFRGQELMSSWYVHSSLGACYQRPGRCLYAQWCQGIKWGGSFWSSGTAARVPYTEKLLPEWLPPALEKIIFKHLTVSTDRTGAR